MKDNYAPKILGKLIKRYRLIKQMTQMELAEKANINESYLSTVESGYNIISISKYLSICEGLEISPDTIIREYIELKAEADKEKEESK